ncbi:MAG: hypothetical protein ABFD23_01985 [Caldisericales bacterium]|nr:hypothetical protein [bacterium]
MNKKVQIVVLVVVAVLVLLFIAFCILCQREVGTINTFGEKSDMAFIINRTSHLESTSIKKEIKEICGWAWGYPGYYFYGNGIAKLKIEDDGYITNELLDAITNKDNYLEFPGKTISQLGKYFFLIQKEDGNYICKTNEQDDKLTMSGYTKTPCSRILYLSPYHLFCTTPKNDTIYMYLTSNLKDAPKILKLDKPSFISGPEREYFTESLYVFDGQFLTHYNDDGSVDGTVKLDDAPINDRMILIGYFNVSDNNEVLFYDGSNAWSVSFKEKKVLWKKQIGIIGNGADRLGCYFVPTKQGIMAISSSTGETKLIVDGDGWKLVDSLNNNENNLFSSVNTAIFLRQLGNNKYEPVLLLATEGKAKVVTCEPFEGEYKGYFFLQDARISLEKSVFNFVFLTHNRVYQYSIKRPFKIVFK